MRRKIRIVLSPKASPEKPDLANCTDEEFLDFLKATDLLFSDDDHELDWHPPGPNFLAEFRNPMTEVELDEAAAELGCALEAVFANLEKDEK